MCERYIGILGLDPISADPAHREVVAKLTNTIFSPSMCMYVVAYDMCGF